MLARSVREALACGAAVGLSLGSARAEPERAEATGEERSPEAPSGGARADRVVGFVWEGPPGVHDCMTPQALRAAVESDIGRSLFRDPPADVTLRVRVERIVAGGFRAVLVIEGADGRTWGQRELSVAGPSCAALDEPLTLAATLLVDEDMLKPPPKEEPRPEPPPPAEPPRLVIENPKPPPETGATSAPWRFGADAMALAGGALLPSLSIGGEVGLEAAPPGWPALRLRGAVFPSSQEDIQGGGSIRFSFAYAGLSVCPDLLSHGRVTAAVCVGADLGRLTAESRGVLNARKTSRVVAQGSFGGRVSVRVAGPWFVRLAAALLPALARDEYVVKGLDGSDELVFQRSPFSWVLGVGGGIELGAPPK